MFNISLISVLPLAIAAWVNALMYKCLGDMAGGERKSRSFLLKHMLRNASPMTQLIASIGLLVLTVCLVLLLIAGPVWAVAVGNGVLGAVAVAGTLLMAFSGWFAAQYAQTLGDIVSGEVRVFFAFFKPFLSHSAGMLHRGAAIILTVAMVLAAVAVIGGVVHVVDHLNPTLSELSDFLADVNPDMNAQMNGVSRGIDSVELSAIIEKLEQVDPAMANVVAGWRTKIIVSAFKNAGVCTLSAVATFLGAWAFALQLQALSDAAEKRRKLFAAS